MREMGKHTMKWSIFYHQCKQLSGEDVAQLVLPKGLRDVVLKSLHDYMEHLGIERTTDLLRSRFLLPKMSQDAEQYVNNCGECITRKSTCPQAAPLHQIVSSGPVDFVCVDFLSMEPDSKGISIVLVVTDHVTRYATKNQKAQIVANIMGDGYFVHYGLPTSIQSAQGRDFESHLIQGILKVMGIRKSRTTPYHPLGDPQPERLTEHYSLLDTLNHQKKHKWSHYVGYFVHAYNSTKCDATGYSLYILMSLWTCALIPLQMVKRMIATLALWRS